MCKLIFATALALTFTVFAYCAAFTESTDTSGFTHLNADGSFGPYETTDSPTIVDRGSYVQSGEIWETFIDQYGNGYYLDLGPAPQVSPQSPARSDHCADAGTCI